jgi:glutathione S-transferase
MYRLFIANKNYSSWSLRPWVLMQECAIPFEEQQVRFLSSDNWEQFRAFAPNGQVPCLHDGQARVWDTLAIVEYLAERHPGIWPDDPLARAWARCAAAEMHSGFSALRNHFLMSCGVRIRLHTIPDPVRRDIDRIDELWSEGLARFGGPFLAGKAFTAADAFFAPVVFRAQTYGLKLGEVASAYAARLLDRPAMRRWYAEALAEPFREESHDKEAQVAGTVMEDLRVRASGA